jgi:type IV pilus assembly protein PilV
VKRYQHGFSMLETLVAVLIFALAVLGQAGMQMVSLSNNKGADVKSNALLLVDDLADRMRANREAVTGGSYNNPAAADLGCSAVHFLDRHPTPAVCTPDSMAKDDVNDWNTMLSGLLPGGSGVVCIDSTPNDGTSAAAPSCDNVGPNYAIKVWWTEKQAASASNAVAIATPAMLAVAFQP